MGPFDLGQLTSASQGATTNWATLVALGIGDVILSQGSDEGADLVVMGGYGHSRLREMLVGGVRRDGRYHWRGVARGLARSPRSALGAARALNRLGAAARSWSP